MHEWALGQAVSQTVAAKDRKGPCGRFGRDSKCVTVKKGWTLGTGGITGESNQCI